MSRCENCKHYVEGKSYDEYYFNECSKTNNAYYDISEVKECSHYACGKPLYLFDESVTTRVALGRIGFFENK